MTPDPARGRYFMMTFHRILGAGLVILGILVARRALDWPEQLAWVLIALGLFDAFVAPMLLARLWRTPPL